MTHISRSPYFIHVNISAKMSLSYQWRKVKRNNQSGRLDRNLLKLINGEMNFRRLNAPTSKNQLENLVLLSECASNSEYFDDTASDTSSENDNIIDAFEVNESSGMINIGDGSNSEETVYAIPHDDIQNLEIELDEQVSNDMRRDSVLSHLQTWATENAATHTSIKGLLNIFNKHFPNLNLPTDARTLMETPRSLPITSGEGLNGEYFHYGMEKALLNALQYAAVTVSKINLNINIDGLPLFQSSRKEFWPILVNIHEMKNIPPLIIGIYCGPGIL